MSRFLAALLLLCGVTSTAWAGNPPGLYAPTPFSDGGTLSVPRSLTARDNDWINAVNNGVVLGGTDQTANMSSVVQLGILGSPVQVGLPTGTYTIGSVVNALGRNPTFILPEDATVNGFNLASNGGATVRPRRTNAWTFGTYDNATGASVIANAGYDQPSQVIGVSTPSGFASYATRDSVGLYTSNNAPAPISIPSSSYTATTIVPSADVSVSQLRVGMLIDTLHTPKYTGQITGWAADGSSITVSGWFQQGNTAAGQVPAAGVAAYLNPITAVWAQNAVVFLNANSLANQEIGMETDVINNKAAYVPNINPVLASPVSFGHFVNCVGTYQCGQAVLASGNFYNGFESHGGSHAGFAVTSSGTQNPAIGFLYNVTAGLAFSAVNPVTGNTFFSVGYNVGSSLVLSLGEGNGSFPYIDFFATSPGSRDARIIVSSGTLGLRANTTQITDGGGNIGVQVSMPASTVDFFNFTPAATGGTPTLTLASVVDTNIPLSIGAKGSGSLKLGLSANAIGFYGSAGIAKATLTGACAGNTGCQALAAELASLGLITNSITN